MSFLSLTALFQDIPTASAGLIALIAGIFGIGFLIGFHELGHFLFAKLFKIRTPSFSIGFGPRLISKKIGETEFSLSAIPLGGYVELAGSAEIGQGEQKDALARDEHSFIVKPYYQKLLVMSGGILFNLLFAYLALLFLFMVGMPKSPYLYPLNATTTVASVAEDSAAQHAGILPGDTIISLNDESYENKPFDLIKAISLLSQSNKTADLGIERDGKNLRIALSPLVNTEKNGMALGVQFVEPLPKLSFMEALSRSINVTNLYIMGTLRSFKNIFWKRDMSNMGGPITIISETIKGAGKGFKTALVFLAIISINLAILNLIPVPILDGGQILFYTIEAIIGRSLPLYIREYIFIASWLAFFLLILYLSYYDILRVINTVKN